MSKHTVKLAAMGSAGLMLFGLSLPASATLFTTCGTPPRSACVVPEPGASIPPPPVVSGKEMSTHTPGTWGTGGDRSASGALDAEQNIAWDGIGGTADTFDYTGSRANDTQDREVDALANSGDILYFDVIGNRAALLFSVDDDPNIYSESIFGAGGVWADQSISTPDGTLGSDIDDMNPILDTDGLEVWGLDGPAGDDANNYSLESSSGPIPYTAVPSGAALVFGGVPDPLSVSVWSFTAGVSTPNWTTTEIATIVSLATGIQLSQLDDINLDGMMTFDPDDIMFTIDPILAIGGSTLLDGGEIFVGTRGAAGIAGSFLSHGGHLWDTAFDVMGTFGLQHENVNALEAVAVSEPASLALMGLGLAGLSGFKRRQATRVPRT